MSLFLLFYFTGFIISFGMIFHLMGKNKENGNIIVYTFPLLSWLCVFSILIVKVTMWANNDDN